MQQLRTSPTPRWRISGSLAEGPPPSPLGHWRIPSNRPTSEGMVRYRALSVRREEFGQHQFDGPGATQCVAWETIALIIADEFFTRWAPEILGRVDHPKRPARGLPPTECRDWPLLRTPAFDPPKDWPVSTDQSEVTEAHHPDGVRRVNSRNGIERRYMIEAKPEQVSDYTSLAVVASHNADAIATTLTERYREPVAIAVRQTPRHYAAAKRTR
jgi:hypothetical protein